MYGIILSSLIYLGAFIYADYLYAGVFVWMLPLLITDKNKDWGFKAGYVWGLLFFSGHLAWLGFIIYNKGQGEARMIVYFVAVAYFSLFSGSWLWFKQLLMNRYVSKIKNLNRKCVASCCTWVISTVTFIYLTCYCSLVILDCFEGYSFINPLLPLVSWRWYLRPIIYLGTIPYLIIIVLVNYSAASLYIKFDIKSLIFLFMLLGFPSLFQSELKNIVVKKNDIFYIQPIWNEQNVTQAHIFYAIGRQLNYIAQTHPHAQYIIMPESSFPYNLMHWENKLDAWTSLFDNATIFIGGHRHDTQGNVHNSLYCIADGQVVSYYDKSHLVPFVERIPAWIQSIPVFNCLFTTSDHIFSYPTHRQDIVMKGFQPCICSELFFAKNRPVGNKPILFICNDSWLALDYAKKLAKRSAQLYSLQYHVPIIYVGWYDWSIMGS